MQCTPCWRRRSAGGTDLFAKLLLVVCAWFPYIVVFWPSGPCSDPGGQLKQFYGEIAFSAHHPVASTLVYGVVDAFGNVAGLGYGAIVLFQAILLLGTVYIVLRVMMRLGAPRFAIWLAAVFYSVVPVFGVYTQFLVRDVLFSALFAAYLALVILLVFAPRPFCKSLKCMIALFAMACMCGIVRNNGLYIVVLSLPFLLIANRAQWSRPILCGLLALSIAGIPVANIVIKELVGAESGNVREALSLPFQQVARVFSGSLDDVSDWEYGAIDGVLDAETLGSRYVEYISDPVKNIASTEEGRLCDFLEHGCLLALSTL